MHCALDSERTRRAARACCGRTRPRARGGSRSTAQHDDPSDMGLRYEDCARQVRGHPRYLLPAPIMGLWASRVRHDSCPQSTMIRGVLSPDPVGSLLSLIGDRSTSETACNVDAEVGCLWSVGICSRDIAGRLMCKTQLMRSPSRNLSAWMSARAGTTPWRSIAREKAFLFGVRLADR